MTRFRDRLGHTVEPTPTGYHVRLNGTDITSQRNRVARPTTPEGLVALGVDLASLELQ